jgi:hypothetical protein
MPDTFVKIATVTVGAGGASSMDFSSIPATYTDLKVLYSIRGSTADGDIRLAFNGSTTGYSVRILYGTGSAAASTSASGSFVSYGGLQNPSTYTASTFSNGEIYIPNYAGSNQKSISTDAVNENNATTAITELGASLWTGTAAITSIAITHPAANFVQYSTATLYGISNT